MGNIFLLYILSPKFEKFFTWVIIVYCCIDETICTEWQKSENGLNDYEDCNRTHEEFVSYIR